jgi:hypothetical protein
MFSESYLTCNLDHGADFCDIHKLKFRIYQTKKCNFQIVCLGDFRERCRTAKDEQGQNKHPSSAKFPPSFAMLGGGISEAFLKKGHRLFS